MSSSTLGSYYCFLDNLLIFLQLLRSFLALLLGSWFLDWFYNRTLFSSFFLSFLYILNILQNLFLCLRRRSRFFQDTFQLALGLIFLSTKLSCTFLRACHILLFYTKTTRI